MRNQTTVNGPTISMIDQGGRAERDLKIEKELGSVVKRIKNGVETGRKSLFLK